MKQAECILLWYMSDAVHLESALLFETPEEIFERVFRIIKPRTELPRITVGFWSLRMRTVLSDSKTGESRQGLPIFFEMRRLRFSKL